MNLQSSELDLSLYDPRGTLSRRRVGSSSFSDSSPSPLGSPSLEDRKMLLSPSSSHSKLRKLTMAPSGSVTREPETMSPLSKATSLLESLPTVTPRAIPMHDRAGLHIHTDNFGPMSLPDMDLHSRHFDDRRRKDGLYPHADSDSQSRSRSRRRRPPSRPRGQTPPARTADSLARSPAEAFLSSLSASGDTSMTSATSVADDTFESTVVDGWRIGKTVGSGAYSIVKACQNVLTGQKAAVKIITETPDQDDCDLTPAEARSRANSTPQPFSSVRTTPPSLTAVVSALSRPDGPSREPSNSKLQTHLDRETQIWSQLAPHQNVMPLLTVIRDSRATYIFMPLCEGGNLLEYINDYGRPEEESLSRSRSIKRTKRRSYSASIEAPVNQGLPLTLARDVFTQVARGVAHLHASSVTHRDIKLENILRGSDGFFKISDFGLALIGIDPDLPNLAHHEKEMSAPPNMQGSPSSSPQMMPFPDLPVGTLNYCPPEMLRNFSPASAMSADIWALGCVLYAIVDGELPFADGFEPRLRMKIIKGQWELPRLLAIRGAEGSAIAEVLYGCLQIAPASRWTIQQVLGSAWLTQDWPDQDLPTRSFTTTGREHRSRSRSRGRQQFGLNTRQLGDFNSRHSPYSPDFHRSSSRSRTRQPQTDSEAIAEEAMLDKCSATAHRQSNRRSTSTSDSSRSRTRESLPSPMFTSSSTEEGLPFRFDRSDASHGEE